MVPTMLSNDDGGALVALGAALAAQAAVRRHRAVLVLAGAAGWTRHGAAALCAPDGDVAPAVMWLGPGPGLTTNPALPTRAPGRARDLLGHEFDRVVLDLHVGFDPEALGAVGGTVRAGGLLVLLTPPLEAWPRWPDPGRARVTVEGYEPEAVGTRLVTRLAAMFATAAGVTVVAEGEPLPALPLAEAAMESPLEPPLSTATPEGVAHPRVEDAEGESSAEDEAEPTDGEEASAGAVPAVGPRTPDQAVAVQAIVRVATGRKRRPVVLTSDRGRGKSAALGLAAGRLLAERRLRIAVTAPNQGSVQPVLAMAAAVLGEPGRTRWPLIGPHQGQLVYVSPGELLNNPQGYDLLLVDEAATLPVPVLSRLLDRYARIAFATTVHGYEGTGRGFTLRFREILDARTPGWRAVTLETPVRFAAGDPLEAFTFAALCLDATAAPDAAVAEAHAAGCVAERLDRDALAADEGRLRALFGLLVTAHYRTTPGDLYRLLDGPNLSVDVLWWGEHIVAAALVATEGGLSPELCAAVYEGRRRPQGHMIPETLCMHAGVELAPRLKGARVVRIAVHPGVRSRGLGGALLAHVIERARADALDWVGSGFGATARLMRFWARGGLSPVRMGVTRGRSSGAWSAVVLKPLSAAGRDLFATVQRRMRDELPHALTDSLREASVKLALSLVRATGSAMETTHEDREAAAAVAFGPRISDVASAAIWRCVWRGLSEEVAELDPLDCAVLVRRVIQRWPWEALVADLAISGRVPAQNRLRAGLAALLVPLSTVDEIKQFQRFADEARTVLPPTLPE